MLPVISLVTVNVICELVSVFAKPSLSISGYLFWILILFTSLNVITICPVCITFSFVPLPVNVYIAYESPTVITKRSITNITGIVLTKLDGTAKGGIVLAIKESVGIPVKYVGLGEQKEDLRVFDIEKYIYGLFKDL